MPNSLGEFFGYIDEILTAIDDNTLTYFTMAIRFIIPILSFIIIARCARSLFQERSEAEIWGNLALPNGVRIPLNHWENVIGRSKSSDAYIEYPSLSRFHAALNRDSGGQWRIFDLRSKSGVVVNGKQIESPKGAPVNSGDHITLGGVKLVFTAIGKTSEYEQASQRTKPGRYVKQGTTLIFLTELQMLLGLQLCISKGDDLTFALPGCFIAMTAVMWISFALTRVMRRVAFEVETIVFYLCTLGLAVTASSSTGYLPKQLLLTIAGVILFFVIGWHMRDLERLNKLRMPIAAAGLLLLALNLIFSRTVFGAKNWIEIGGISFQPSEFVKIAFIFAGSATLDRLFSRRNLIAFVVFSGACVISLALMNDFGTAMVFFAAYLVIAFLRSGDFATILLSVGGAGFSGFLAVRFKSHIAARFSTWGNAWDAVNAGGFQQSRAMAAIAGGGLFGVGAGNGWLKRVFASDTDLVFGFLSEELGLLTALTAITAIVLLAVFAVRSAGASRSSFYVIGACAAVSVLTFQMMLNVLGSVDIIPFTGVTFPFVSKGGSSLVSCWGLLAFIKSADTRQNASFTIKAPSKPY